MSLERRKPLARGRGPKPNPATALAWQRRSRRPLPRMSARRAESLPDRDRIRHDVFERDRGRCWLLDLVPEHRCSGRLTYHHLRKEGQGGAFTMENGATVCLGGNSGWIEDHPEEAHRIGIVLRSGDSPDAALARRWARLAELPMTGEEIPARDEIIARVLAAARADGCTCQPAPSIELQEFPGFPPLALVAHTNPLCTAVLRELRPVELTTDAEFSIVGVEPMPQGSKTPIVVQRRGQKPQAVLLDGRDEQARARFRAWRKAVKAAAVAWRKEAGMPAPFDGPVEIRLRFYIRKPISKPRWKFLPDRYPDLDKLVRSTLDSLSKVVYTDDARVVRLAASEVYDIDRPEGVEILVRDLSMWERTYASTRPGQTPSSVPSY